MLEMKTIQEKFGTELEIQVRQEMGLPTLQLPSPTFQDPVPTHNPGYGTPSDTPRVTPSSLLTIKKEKFDRDVFTIHKHQLNMEKNTKMLNMSHHQHPNDLQQKKTYSTHLHPPERGKYSCVQLFSPSGKSTGQSLKEDNTLEVRSWEYMTSISCIKHDLMIAAHQFLFKKSPKD